MIFYTDGSARNNPGKGAFAWVNFTIGKQYVSRTYQKVTNNQMELKALIAVLQYTIFLLKSKIKSKFNKVIVYTDSRYVELGFKF